MGLSLAQVLSLAFAALALSSAAAVVFTRHTVYAALFFIVHLMALSVVYAFLHAPLIAVLQVMVYAGAVMVLFLFAIMILDASVLDRMGLGKEASQIVMGLCVVLGLGAAFFLFGRDHLLKLALAPAQDNPLFQAENVPQVARLLYRQYLFPFELISVLLVVAVVGIMVMAKKKLEP
jgi:NADH-quinone oxidoreductase subunit J